MKENVDKKLDHLARTVIGELSVEHTSTDFTKNLMLQIHALNTSKLTTYKPLISKPIWLALAALVMGIFGYAFWFSSEVTSGPMLDLDLKSIFENQVNVFSGFEVSQVAIYSVVLFSVMLCIQIPLLKHILDKRYKI